MDPSDHDRLRVGRLPQATRGLVLMLHGGAERGLQEVDHRSLAFQRTWLMFESIGGRLRHAGAGVALLRFSVKGWNAGHADVPAPVIDARRALAQLHDRHPDLPIVILGHSMGARTAAWVADAPGVTGIVGLAPWFPADDPVRPLAGKRVVAAHGRRDRITSARASAAYLRRAESVAASTRFVDMGALGHYMVAGWRRWNDVAVTESLALLP
jgi:alpha-beta hydrolase superfamily lysophospholipase